MQIKYTKKITNTLIFTSKLYNKKNIIILYNFAIITQKKGNIYENEQKGNTTKSRGYKTYKK